MFAMEDGLKPTKEAVMDAIQTTQAISDQIRKTLSPLHIARQDQVGMTTEERDCQLWEVAEDVFAKITENKTATHLGWNPRPDDPRIVLGTFGDDIKGINGLLGGHPFVFRIDRKAGVALSLI